MADQKGKRTKSRKQQILEFYAKCKEEDVRDLKQQLESMGERVDSRLQGEHLFLYFMQFGKCAYSGMPIELEKLMSGSKEYDIDHIYPQAYVKDDSIINNKVLVLSKINGGKGKCLVAQSVMQFSSENCWKSYMKKLEKFIEKFKKNPDFIYDKEYDKVSTEENQKLYELYIEKLQNTIYSKRVNSPVQILMDGQEQFGKLNIKEQCVVLMNIQTVFGRMTSGCDLSLSGGSPNSGATVKFSSTISNWRKNYSDVRIIDQSPSGIWEKRSENILELL